MTNETPNQALIVDTMSQFMDDVISIRLKNGVEGTMIFNDLSLTPTGVGIYRFNIVWMNPFRKKKFNLGIQDLNGDSIECFVYNVDDFRGRVPMSSGSIYPRTENFRKSLMKFLFEFGVADLQFEQERQ